MKSPEYRQRLTTGIVHFGPGAFHRAHQADYVDRLLAEDPRWGIAAVSLRTSTTVESLRRQDGLYTLAILDAETNFRTIGAHSELYGPGDASAIRRRLADPNVHLVSSTVTEKGYCLAADGTLDFDHQDIIHDLERPATPTSIVGWLALGLADRWRAGLKPFVPLCCDNMVANGRKLGSAVVAFAGRIDPELGRWIDGEARFPNTMVDSITPATDRRLLRLVREATGSDDRIPVSREAFKQWVIEDLLPPGAADLASTGIELTSDVAAWERTKLRILNGAHSTLAYLGLLAGYETVADAMADQQLALFVQSLLLQDVAPTLEPSALDLSAYVAATLQRFRNPAIQHRLSQIAWDGSQKLPYRLLDTILDARSAGRPLGRLAVPVAAWILFIERQAAAGADIVDPLAPALRSAALRGDAVAGLIAMREVFPAAIADDPSFRSSVAAAAEGLRVNGVQSAIRIEQPACA